MSDAVPKSPPSQRWLWMMGAAVVIVAAAFWLGAPWDTGRKAAALQPVAQPVARSTNWAIEPTGPAVPVNLPKTVMTNAPDTQPPGAKVQAKAP